MNYNLQIKTFCAGVSVCVCVCVCEMHVCLYNVKASGILLHHLLPYSLQTRSLTKSGALDVCLYLLLHTNT